MDELPITLFTYKDPTEEELREFIESFDSKFSEYSSLIPELKDIYSLDQKNPYHCYTVYQHTIVALKNLPFDSDLITVLSMLFHDIGKPISFFIDENGIGHAYGHGKTGSDLTRNILIRLGYCDYITNKVCELIYYHDNTFDLSRKYIIKLSKKLGIAQMNRLLKIRESDIIAQTPQFLEKRRMKLEKFKELYNEVLNNERNKITLDISGEDIIKCGVSPGPSVGIIKNNLIKLIKSNKLKNNKNDLLEKVYAIHHYYENTEMRDE